jgi:hypothetical protein
MTTAIPAWSLRTCLILAGLALGSVAPATPTENLGVRVLPAPARVVIDGRINDWDLSGGIFACDDVENQRGKYAVWFHAMYDADNLYLLARFIDETPLNNPGQTIADNGFAGDSLQVRTICSPGTPEERGQHFTCWKGRDGADVIKVEQGADFKEGVVEDAKKTSGAQQAFAVDGDGKGYVQEIALPWKLLTRGGQPLRAGESFALTIEPNFTLGGRGRLSVKDIFKPGVTPDRVFTFMASRCWGTATLEAAGKVKPQPLRLADGREFQARLDSGVPAVEWTGLVKPNELPGFIPVVFTMPFDGFISLNIRNSEGRVVRQLLNATFFTKGAHEVKWDALSTWSWTRPGEPVPAGQYTWSALVHAGIGLKLRGWACNGGVTPWDSPDGKGNWGGDQGVPVAVAAEGKQVFLGWNCAEAGKAVLACDLQGRVQWSNNRGGIAGVKALAADNGVLYVLGGLTGPDAEGANIYKLNAKDGSYLEWEGAQSADLKIKNLWSPDAKTKPDRADELTFQNNRLIVGFRQGRIGAVIDPQTGKLLETIGLAPSKGETTRFLVKDGFAYVWHTNQQIRVFNQGNLVRTIGLPGGRPLLGPWQAGGLRFVDDMALDSMGKLWVAEADSTPKRFSVWDTATGRLVSEFFGPTSYGALGGAICPVDPNVMVGQGCEWRLDAQTGRALCTGVITREGMENSRFAIGPNGRLYLAVAGNWAYNNGPLRIYERLGDADYRLRTVIFQADSNGKELPASVEGQRLKAARTMVWSDANGDGLRQPDEISGVEGELRFSAWYMNLAPDLSLYSGSSQFKLVGFTPCGAPRYDLSKPVKMPVSGLGSADGRLVLRGGDYGETHTWLTCADIASGRTLWTYPDNFNGVHGSHNACPPTGGMIRGSFGPCGSAKLPRPIGNLWVIPSNVGEWHLLTEEGFYLGRLFEGDPMQVKWPGQAAPGADMTHCPPGMGGEDFGGSIALGTDGKLYVQAGKTAFWNLEVTGLEAVQALPGQTVEVAAKDLAQALSIRDQQLQAAVGTRRATVKKMTPEFTGNLDSDFKDADFIGFQKTEESAVRAAGAWDEQNLYLAWDVHDKTPWTNGAEQPEDLYLSGDTVDFQIGAGLGDDPKRSQAVLGDLRLSIGNFKGTATAVLYRPVARTKLPKTFSSGVVREYTVDDVEILQTVRLRITQHSESYLVEAAIPLTSLGFKPADGAVLRGDFGVTYGDAGGRRTRLRNYWSNQRTGIVDDAVFELMLEPKNWGEFLFKQ